jgi:putative ABC transport system permease protein
MRRTARLPRPASAGAAAHRQWRPWMSATWSQLTGTGAAASIGLALLAGVCVFVCVAAPRASLQFRTRALQQVLATVSATTSSISASLDASDMTVALGRRLQASDVAAARAELTQHLRRFGLPFSPASTDWGGTSTNLVPVSNAARTAYAGPLPPAMEVLYRDALRANSRLIAGHLPQADFPGAQRTVFQAAVTAATATRFSLHVGSVLALANGVTLSVTGIIAPIAPRSAFWTVEPTAGTPLTITNGVQEPPYWTGAVFIGRDELPDLQSYPSQLTAEWNFPLRLRGLTADQATGLRHQLADALAQAGTLTKSTNDEPANVGLSTGMIQDLTSFVTADQAIASLLALLFVSLAVVGAVVVLLGARLLTDHRDAELMLMRARGAALWQLAWVALRGGAVVGLPAAIMAGAIAVAVTPGAGDPLSWQLAGLTVLAALAGPPLIAVTRNAGRRLPSRADAAPGWRSRARRVVTEATLVCAAAGGLVILRLQGLPAPGSTSFFLSTAPVLVAIPAAVLVVRCYPVLLGWLLRFTRGYRGVTGYVGLARSTRTSLAAALPAFALVLALAVIAFGGMVRAAVVRGEVAASWQTTGADALIGQPDSGISLTPVAQQAIARVPGVEHTAGVLDTPGTIGPVDLGGTPVHVAVLDPVRYAAVLADTPAPPFPARALARPGGSRTGPVPVLTSPTVAALLHHSGDIMSVGIRNVRVRVAGVISGTPAIAEPGPFIVFPRWAAGPDPLPPTMLFLAGPGLDQRALDKTVQQTAPAAVITLRSTVLAGLRSAPLPYAGYLAFAEGAAAAGGFSVLILLLTLVFGARSRELTLARLSTMGLSRRQARRLAVIETLPSVLAATVGGIACAWALAPLIGPELDLSVFTGYGLSEPVRADVGALAITAGSLVVLTLVTLAAQAAVAGRRGTGRALRVGE